ncbi:ATP-binding protein [Pannonibacter sp. Pt2-lr]
MTDADALRQILINLMLNAVRASRMAAPSP